MSRRILVTGAAGYLGSRIAEALVCSGARVMPCTRADADLTDALAVRVLLEEFAPTHV
ncbi:MAG: sugar nucleotide-binding protein, partial [Rhizobiaceae bacterium]